MGKYPQKTPTQMLELCDKDFKAAIMQMLQQQSQTLEMNRKLANFSCERPILTILGFSSDVVSVASTQFCDSSHRGAWTTRKQMGVTVVQENFVCGIWPVDCSSPTLDYSVFLIVNIFTEFLMSSCSIDCQEQVLKSFTMFVDLLISPLSSVSFSYGILKL